VQKETVSGSGISWRMCKSAPRSRQTTTPATHHSVIYKPDAPAAQNKLCQSSESTALVTNKESERVITQQYISTL